MESSRKRGTFARSLASSRQQNHIGGHRAEQDACSALEEMSEVRMQVTQEIKPTNRYDHSLGELFSELIQDAAILVRQEVALAKAEVSRKISSVGKKAGIIAVGGVIAFAGFLVLLAALVLGIATTGLPLWASALIVGGVLFFLGGIFVIGALMALKHTDPVPRQTLETLKEDIQWARQKTH